MKRLAVVLMGVLLLTACSAVPPVPHGAKHRGMSYAAAPPRLGTYGSPQSAESLDALRKLGVEWITIMPFGFHRGTPELSFGGERVWETDVSLVAVTKQAHARGMKVMLKLHVWGRGEQAMESWSEAEWRQWLDGYGRFVEHYARLARDAKVDAFCIGNEQKIASRNDAAWRGFIARARAVYPGPLTYGANFDEIFDVPFWDALDWIGVSGYFPLSPDATPSRDALVTAWQPILARLQALSGKHRKPVLFTEIGYRSANGAVWRQWEIPRDVPANPDAQRIAYEAFFEAVWPQPWVLGAYPWKWFSYPGHGRAEANDYDFETKPAAEVIRRAYGS